MLAVAVWAPVGFARSRRAPPSVVPKDTVEPIESASLIASASIAHPATVAFRSFPSVRHDMVQRWVRFRDGVVQPEHPSLPRKPRPAVDGARTASAPAEISEGLAVYWRLMAPNHRELGRSAFLYPSFAKARSHVLRIIAASDQLVATAVTDPGTARRGWMLRLDGAPVMTCARWYASSSSSTAAAALAALSIRTAAVADAAVAARAGDARRGDETVAP